MSTPYLAKTTEARCAVSALLENAPPVLVEVRFPGAGTSPDWYLCEDEEEFEQIWHGLSPGADVHVSSVWDLKNTKEEISLRK